MRGRWSRTNGEPGIQNWPYNIIITHSREGGGERTNKILEGGKNSLEYQRVKVNSSASQFNECEMTLRSCQVMCARLGKMTSHSSCWRFFSRNFRKKFVQTLFEWEWSFCLSCFFLFKVAERGMGVEGKGYHYGNSKSKVLLLNIGNKGA